jgi:hypothetical protein
MLSDLSLAQEYAIIASDAPLRQKIRLTRSYRQLYTVGAAIIDMVLNGQLHWNERGALELVDFSSNQNAGEAQLLQIIQAARRPKKMKAWMTYFLNHPGKRSNIFNALIQPLLQQGQLRQEPYKVLFIFPANRYVVSAPDKDRIIQKLRAELLEDGPVTVQTAVLGMLLDISKLLKYFFSDYEEHSLKLKLEQLQAEQSSNWKAIIQIKKAIEEMEATGATIGAISAAGA